MKNLKKGLFLVFLFLSVSLMTTSCKTKEGCDNVDRYSVKTDKDGNMTSKRGKSNLWSKKQRKRASK